jgi:hypothetical protein
VRFRVISTKPKAEKPLTEVFTLSLASCLVNSPNTARSMISLLHVNKVDHDHATQITQSQLTRYGACCF